LPPLPCSDHGQMNLIDVSSIIIVPRESVV